VTFGDLPAVRDVPSVSAAQMAEVDRRTIHDFAIGVDLLMENASHQIARAARHVLGGRVTGMWVFGLIGAGNNGADTAGALRHLENWGATSQAIATGAVERLHKPLESQITRLIRVAAFPEGVIWDDEGDPGPRKLGSSQLILDGLLGYGARGAPRRREAQLIAAANASGARILAVDIPSGVDPDTGATPGVAIRATATVTLALPKTGLMAPAAREFVGDLLLADIGIPIRAFHAIGIDTSHLFLDGDLVRVMR
jgi:NAD(P)H-hydrate epimerase